MTTRPIELKDWELEGIKAKRISMLWRPVEPQPRDDADDVFYWCPPSGKPEKGYASPGLYYWCPSGLRTIECPFGEPGGILEFGGVTMRIAGVCAKRVEDITYAESMDTGVSDRCDQCGYTLLDAQEHMDHRLCVARGGKDLNATEIHRRQWDDDYGDKYPSDSNPWAWGLRIEVVG